VQPHGALLPLSPACSTAAAAAVGGGARLWSCTKQLLQPCHGHVNNGGDGSSDARFISVVETMAKHQLMPNNEFSRDFIFRRRNGGDASLGVA
jgi:hypothetical protein